MSNSLRSWLFWRPWGKEGLPYRQHRAQLTTRLLSKVNEAVTLYFESRARADRLCCCSCSSCLARCSLYCLSLLLPSSGSVVFALAAIFRLSIRPLFYCVWVCVFVLINKKVSSASISISFLLKKSVLLFLCSCGPTIGQDMVSRRRILSRSRDDLNLDNFPEEEDDVWHIKEKLYKVSRVKWSNNFLKLDEFHHNYRGYQCWFIFSSYFHTFCVCCVVC